MFNTTRYGQTCSDACGAMTIFDSDKNVVQFTMPLLAARFCIGWLIRCPCIFCKLEIDHIVSAVSFH